MSALVMSSDAVAPQLKLTPDAMDVAMASELVPSVQTHDCSSLASSPHEEVMTSTVDRADWAHGAWMSR